MDSVGLARVARWVVAVLAGFSVLVPPRAAASATPSPPVRIEVWADQDDDDTDGRPDGQQTVLPPAARIDAVPIEARLWGAPFRVVRGGDHVRFIGAGGDPSPLDRVFPARASIQGLSVGRVELVADVGGVATRIAIDVSSIGLRDGQRRDVDIARSHVSLARTPPERFDRRPDAAFDDEDAFRVVVSRPGEMRDAADGRITVESVTASGMVLDSVPSLPLSQTACPNPIDELRCWASAPLRLVTDDVDRNHPLAMGRSLRAQVGGAIVFRSHARKAQMVRVLGPRSSPIGSIGRYRATLRSFVLRVSPGGAPAIGGSDAGAIEGLRAELGAASAIWGQCGLTFGDPRALEVRVVDPPPSHLVSIGDDLGLPASGGDVRLRVDGRGFALSTFRREPASRVAADLALTLERAGFGAIVSPNARIGPGMGPSVDVSVRRKDGTLSTVDAPLRGPLSTDPSLSVRIGSIDLSDGLEHFSDVDAMAGTLEERTLIKALDDGDPSTIEIIVVPLFQGGGRIGESFIASDVSSVRNVVLLDRAGMRARKSSLTLAHELGHVLLDLPGHPDDYGIDTPTMLMDSDAADASPYGPRRIPVDECARVIRQAGPQSRSPLLAEWPITPIALPAARPDP